MGVAKGSKQPARANRRRLPAPELTRSNICGPSRQTRTHSWASMRERLRFLAYAGLEAQTGLQWMRGFCHPNSLARKEVTKPRPPWRRPSPRDRGCCGSKCCPQALPEPRPCASPEGLQMFTRLDYIMNIIAKPTTGSKQPARADRQRPMRPSPGKPRHIPRPACAAASLPQGSERSDRLEVDRGILSPQPPRARVGDKKRLRAAGHNPKIAGVAGRNDDPRPWRKEL